MTVAVDMLLKTAMELRIRAGLMMAVEEIQPWEWQHRYKSVPHIMYLQVQTTYEMVIAVSDSGVVIVVGVSLGDGSTGGDWTTWDGSRGEKNEAYLCADGKLLIPPILHVFGVADSYDSVGLGGGPRVSDGDNTSGDWWRPMMVGGDCGGGSSK
ncbi:hypothetical protein L2E82_29496 [Cichorium intybus]|uniref:Uncharacterized protein n=1 Tax=Cichorium intybus TaxID=13427 RepID=A0ACB9CXQ1_CICIN|nr:hypothetical protein L2E82_29496 [Cichorium intybus]